MESSEEKKGAVADPSGEAAASSPPVQESEPQALPDDSGDLPAADEDWDSRVLCSDESCIGVIGPDGRCRQCGKPAGPDFTPPPDARPDGGAPPAEAPEPAPDLEPPAQAEGDIEEDLVIDDEEWQQRILCSDESCIGVIGPDGRCRECGRPYAPEESP